MENIRYTILQTKKMLDILSQIFDIARIVDPVSREVFEFDDDGKIHSSEYLCYKVWTKQERCQNCVSLKAVKSNRRLTKYEFVEDDIYHVVVKPMELIKTDGSCVNCALELVSKITDEILFDAFGKSEVVEKIVESEKRMYTDSLTQVYNRRFYDDSIFCHSSKGELSNRVIFILVDLKEFKRINDNYGHDVGDLVLKSVGKIMLECVRKNDFVIRIGGDEFLIILNDCAKDNVGRIIRTIKERFKHEVKYDGQTHNHVVGNFGISYTENFRDEKEFIADLMKQADEAMYIDKNSN